MYLIDTRYNMAVQRTSTKSQHTAFNQAWFKWNNWPEQRSGQWSSWPRSSDQAPPRPRRARDVCVTRRARHAVTMATPSLWHYDKYSCLLTAIPPDQNCLTFLWRTNQNMGMPKDCMADWSNTSKITLFQPFCGKDRLIRLIAVQPKLTT